VRLLKDGRAFAQSSTVNGRRVGGSLIPNAEKVLTFERSLRGHMIGPHRFSAPFVAVHGQPATLHVPVVLEVRRRSWSP
jgi:hypothetical protein